MMLRFEKNRSAMAIWDAVKIQFGGTSTIRLRQLTLKFDAYKKQSNHIMRVESYHEATLHCHVKHDK